MLDVQSLIIKAMKKEIFVNNDDLNIKILNKRVIL